MDPSQKKLCSRRPVLSEPDPGMKSQTSPDAPYIKKAKSLVTQQHARGALLGFNFQLGKHAFVCMLWPGQAVDFCRGFCIGGFCRGFSWRTFLGTSTHNNEENNPAAKSAKIRRLQKNERIHSAKTLPYLLDCSEFHCGCAIHNFVANARSQQAKP